MTNVEQAKMNRNAGTCNFLVNNASAFAGDIAFEAIQTKMNADTAVAVTSATAAAEDNTGYSKDKKVAKEIVSQMASTLCASAQVKLLLLNNNTLADALHSDESYYSRASDAQATARLQNVHDILNTNIALITVDYVTPAEVTNFQTKITTYTTLSGSSIDVNKTSPVLTKRFKDDLKTTSADIVSIRKLVKKYKITKPTFYNGVIANCKTPAVNIHHTSVIFTITNSSSGDGIQNVAGTLTKSSETPVSNATGILTYSTVPAGAATATFALTNFATQTMDVVIKRGEVNNFTVQLVPVVLVVAPTTSTI